MNTLSLCMIVKDEEQVIKRCLDSVVGLVDEMIIVDTGSKDSTKNIVKNYTNKIYDYEWNDNFSEARNFSFEKATKDYILWLDADEYITEENIERLIFLKNSIEKNIDIITLNTYICLNENNNPRVICRRNRIVKRSNNYKWVGFLHEYIECSGVVYDSSIFIVHDKVKCTDSRNLNIYKSNLEKGNILSNRDLYYYGQELYCNRLWDEAISVLNTFIEKDVYDEEKIDALLKIGNSYKQKKEYKEARGNFYRTFEYGVPKCEVIFNLAETFEFERKYKEAIQWYEFILNLDSKCDCSQCINISCLRFKPHLNLCICYYEVGNIEKSYYHHLKAKEINSNDKSVIQNDKFFENIF